ncbi:sugar phosphate isomerase/epimerase family protein [Novosphingobium sp. KACC 22771]|uniref:sugar phosphate isomerase/epimerase family protein n=1 Tax=Novosphingobium sp. KACC 22771 TaxID=3025670 RepID=UPI0023653CD0|nr:TIM barrel protein [Novosphingobium sp. KACC 22771]WDF74316.1 TIM barrel protein [Novosphingobium sp. KACC 22771]
MRRLALDHITVTDSTPIELAEIAHATGCAAICLFMEPMAVLPHMPAYDIYTDRQARLALKARMDALGVGLDVAYPFTLAGRTEIEAFIPALECAAELEAKMVNVLAYDRDPARRADKFAAFCDLAGRFDLPVAVEFYPPSQVPSLAEALALVTPVDRPGQVGVNADLLHLMRSGGSVAELAAAPADLILYGQICDGPAQCLEASLDFEASSQRRLIGDGVMDVAGFLAALPQNCPVSVELPQESAIQGGVARMARAQQAVESARKVLEA